MFLSETVNNQQSFLAKLSFRYFKQLFIFLAILEVCSSLECFNAHFVNNTNVHNNSTPSFVICNITKEPDPICIVATTQSATYSEIRFGCSFEVLYEARKTQAIKIIDDCIEFMDKVDRLVEYCKCSTSKCNYDGTILKKAKHIKNAKMEDAKVKPKTPIGFEALDKPVGRMSTESAQNETNSDSNYQKEQKEPPVVLIVAVLAFYLVFELLILCLCPKSK